ncbi:MAG: hypothetical protein A2X96_04580 [Syntrophobacterales bacterium GWC2_56_13]|nr:MAG: hypothetical protein A2X96_04580 [Syntrophobacterales bacterium GWC2_56_13]OHE20662.1 MAG: hypothetical protein A2X95_06285 [Syntrophobacterales bacterium GWF2_56_9]
MGRKFKWNLHPVRSGSPDLHRTAAAFLGMETAGGGPNAKGGRKEAPKSALTKSRMRPYMAKNPFYHQPGSWEAVSEEGNGCRWRAIR